MGVLINMGPHGKQFYCDDLITFKLEKIMSTLLSM